MNYSILGMTCLVTLATYGCSGEVDLESSQQLGEALACNNHVFQVTSPNFSDGDGLLAPHTCQDGVFASGVTPELNWTKGPKKTKSYALVLHDTTLSDPNLAYHWAAWNIPHNVRTLPEGIRGVDASFPDPVPFPDGLGGGQQAQARGIARYFAPCPAWIVRKAIKCEWPEPRPVAAPDSYTFTVYALPDHELQVPAYDATVDPNYVHQLDAIFESIALGSAQIALTADAVPGVISNNGPFNCANAPLASNP
jgi:phosphatidylethanolamine-binding protein (PEBP) family uncharacterized protein